MEPVVITTIVWALILIGLAGTLLPALPGLLFVFGGILLYALYFGVATIGLTTLVLFGVATALSFVFDVLFSLYGAKRFGASRSGIVGSALGGLFGFVVLNIPGLVLGTFLGAVAGEYFFAKKSLRAGIYSGTGSVLGFLAGTIVKFILAIIMIGTFVFRLWF